jgi:hypothetical protein
MSGLGDLGGIGRRRELTLETKSLGVGAARAMRLSEQAVQSIDEIGRGRVRGPDGRRGGEQAKQSGCPEDRNEIDLHGARPL